jgi:hypothetical protein
VRRRLLDRQEARGTVYVRPPIVTVLEIGSLRERRGGISSLAGRLGDGRSSFGGGARGGMNGRRSGGLL